MENGYIFPWRNNVTRGKTASLLVLLDHTHLVTSARNSTPLKEWSDRSRGRYLNITQQTEETNIIHSAGFEPAIPTIERPQIYALTTRPLCGWCS
jgi:hypothetical protein